jgi:large subunit ribosomal protein L32
MAHPKRRQSKTRSRKRRTHYKAETPNVSTCSSTGQAHMFHRAHWYEGKLYYKGRVVMEKESAEVQAWCLESAEAVLELDEVQVKETDRFSNSLMSSRAGTI